MSDPGRPTATELEILHVLWERGPSTVREVHEVLRHDKAIGYTGVLKFLQLMAAKGLVTRNEDQRAHVYAASGEAQTTKRQVAGEFMQRVFAGSASDLVLHALQFKQASPEEIAEIRRMLDDYEKGRTP